MVHDNLKRICVFCGAHFGADPAYRMAAAAFGELLVERGLGLVYGGGNVGLMGVIADTVIAGGGEVIGVIPRSLEDREVAHRGISELQVVDSMHERKRRMYAQADAIVAMPGGIGTFDELFETLTWNQLEIHRKPAGLLNVGGYYDPLIAMLDRAVEQGFVRHAHRRLLVVHETGTGLFEGLAARRAEPPPEWVRPPYSTSDAEAEEEGEEP